MFIITTVDSQRSGNLDFQMTKSWQIIAIPTDPAGSHVALLSSLKILDNVILNWERFYFCSRWLDMNGPNNKASQFQILPNAAFGDW